MIKINRYIYNAVFVSALCLFVISCSKENITNGENNSSSESGMIKLMLSQSSTKTTLGDDGRSPKFIENDEIGVFNDKIENPMTCMVKIDNETNEAYIEVSEELRNGSTSLVYPAKYGDIKTDRVSGKKTFVTKIPADQNGEFRDANICKANNIDFERGYAYFTNSVAILHFDLTKLENIDRIMLIANEEINDASTEDDRYVTIAAGDFGGKELYLATKATTKGLLARIVVGNKSYSYTVFRVNANTIYDVDLSDYKNWEDYP